MCICATKFVHQNIKRNLVMKGHSNYPLPFLHFGHNFIARTRTKVETLSVYAHNPNAKHRTNQTNLNDPAQGSWSGR